MNKSKADSTRLPRVDYKMPKLVPFETLKRRESEKAFVSVQEDRKTIDPLQEYGIISPKTAEVGVG